MDLPLTNKWDTLAFKPWPPIGLKNDASYVISETTNEKIPSMVRSLRDTSHWRDACSESALAGLIGKVPRAAVAIDV